MRKLETTQQLYALKETIEKLFGDIKNLRIELRVSDFEQYELSKVADKEGDYLMKELIEHGNQDYYSVYNDNVDLILTTN